MAVKICALCSVTDPERLKKILEQNGYEVMKTSDDLWSIKKDYDNGGKISGT